MDGRGQAGISRAVAMQALGGWLVKGKHREGTGDDA